MADNHALLLEIAPVGVYPPCQLPDMGVSSYLAISPLPVYADATTGEPDDPSHLPDGATAKTGGIFSVALSISVINRVPCCEHGRPVLRSPDFPPGKGQATARSICFLKAVQNYIRHGGLKEK